MEYIWAFSALTSALAFALMFLVSEHYKQSGVGLLSVIRLGTALTLLPFVFFVEWPKEPLFYIYGAFVFMIFPIADVFAFRVSKQYGAGIITRFTPLTAIVTFFMWLLIDSQTWQKYLTYPWFALGIIACLCGVVFCASSLRRCEVSVAAFKTLFPALLLSPLGVIFAKLTLDSTDSSSGALINLFVGSFIGVAMYGVLYKVMPSVKCEFTMSKLTIKAGVIASIFSTLGIYLSNVSFDLVPNPSYVTVVGFTSAIFVLLIYKIMGKQDNARILPGLGIVLFTALLVILSGRI